MKILRVISSVDLKHGGPINGLVSSSKLLVERGHEVHVATLDEPNSQCLKDFPFPVFAFKSYLGKFSFSLLYYKWLKENVKKYDVVIIQGLWQGHGFLAAKACQKKGVPYVVFTHGMLDPWFNIGAPFKVLKKQIFWKLFEGNTINNAAKVLFTTEEEKMLAKNSFLPYKPNPHVVAYGSSLPEYDSEECIQVFFNKFPELKNKKIILFLSRIHPKKGVDLLIDAISKQNNLSADVVFALAGPGDGYIEKLQRKTIDLGVSNKIFWLGMLKGKEKWGAYNASEAFILPSHQENFGIVVSEALSQSKPVLITNKVNLWREIETFKAGFVVDDTVDGIQKLLSSWFSLADTEKETMSTNALSCYATNFSMNAAVDSLEEGLIQVITANKPKEYFA